jgi:hypothetical protein
MGTKFASRHISFIIGKYGIIWSIRFQVHCLFVVIKSLDLVRTQLWIKPFIERY